MKKPLRVLMIEDSEDDALLLERELRKGAYDLVCERVETEAAMRAALDRGPWDLVLSDHWLPLFSGPAALGVLRASGLDLPFIIVSGTIGEEQAVSAMKAGAHDYLLKGKLARLVPAVERELGEAEERRGRKRAEAALRENEEEFRAMFEVASIGMGQADVRTGQWLRVNEKLCAITGYTAEELLRKRVSDLTHPEDQARDWELLQRVVRGETPDYRLEKRYIRKDGTVAWVNVNMTVLRDAAGQALRTMAAIEDITERKRVEVQVRLQTAALEASANAILITDRAGAIQWINPAWTALTGYSWAEAMGHNPRLLKSGVQDDAFYQKLWQTILAGEVWVGEVVNQRKDGSRYVEEETITPVLDVSGEITHFIGIKQDVSARKHAEAIRDTFHSLSSRLSEASTPLEVARSIFTVADRLWQWDAGTFDVCSPDADVVETVLCVDIVAGERREVPPTGTRGRTTPRLRRIMAQGAQLTLRPQPSATVSDSLRFGDTSRLSASLINVPIRRQGKAVGVLSLQSYAPNAFSEPDLQILQDLADHCGGALERIQAQQEQALLNHTIRASLNEIYLFDAAALRFRFVNDGALANLGYSLEQIRQLTPLDLKPEFTAESFEQLLQPLRQGDKVVQVFQTVHRRADGRDYPVEGHLQFFEHDGDPVFLAVIQDITERKQLEAQLRQAQKMDGIGQLAGGVAHDFNNLLAVMRGNADLLLMEEEQNAPQTNECLKHIAAAAERAASLTRQLLIFSRKQAMQSEPLALNELVQNLIKMLKRVIREDIRLECRYAERLPFVQADPGMLEQVLLNLVVNARDAMPGGGQLLITTKGVTLDAAYAQMNPEARAGEFVCLSVSDTGTGIAPEHLGRIFEPFFTTKEPGKGTGLGLATVYGIVKQHQGWVEVSSRVGEATTFQILLPAVLAPAKAAAVPAGAPLRGGDETILLVEDEYSVRMIMRRVLETFKYKVLEAGCAREAVEVWDQHPGEIALLLSDIMMPEGVTGRDLAEKLRAQKPELKVIFMSGYSAEVVGKDTEFFRRTGSCFLHKPCSTATLLQTVRQSLDAQQLVQDSKELKHQG